MLDPRIRMFNEDEVLKEAEEKACSLFGRTSICKGIDTP